MKTGTKIALLVGGTAAAGGLAWYFFAPESPGSEVAGPPPGWTTTEPGATEGTVIYNYSNGDQWMVQADGDIFRWDRTSLTWVKEGEVK